MPSHNVIECLSTVHKHFIRSTTSRGAFPKVNPQQQHKMATQERDSGSSPDHEQGLSSILSTEERVELTLLLANITEIMRKQITDTFDASVASAKTPQSKVSVTDEDPNVDESEKGKESEEEQKARKLQQEREKELSAPKMLELKEASLKYFDAWRESVIMRVGTAVNTSKEVIEKQKDEATVEATPEAASKEPAAEPKVISKF